MEDWSHGRGQISRQTVLETHCLSPSPLSNQPWATRHGHPRSQSHQYQPTLVLGALMEWGASGVHVCGKWPSLVHHLFSHLQQASCGLIAWVNPSIIPALSSFPTPAPPSLLNCHISHLLVGPQDHEGPVCAHHPVNSSSPKTLPSTSPFLLSFISN